MCNGRLYGVALFSISFRLRLWDAQRTGNASHSVHSYTKRNDLVSWDGTAVERFTFGSRSIDELNTEWTYIHAVHRVFRSTRSLCSLIHSFVCRVFRCCCRFTCLLVFVVSNIRYTHLLQIWYVVDCQRQIKWFVRRVSSPGTWPNFTIYSMTILLFLSKYRNWRDDKYGGPSLPSLQVRFERDSPRSQCAQWARKTWRYAKVTRILLFRFSQKVRMCASGRSRSLRFNALDFVDNVRQQTESSLRTMRCAQSHNNNFWQAWLSRDRDGRHCHSRCEKIKSDEWRAIECEPISEDFSISSKSPRYCRRIFCYCHVPNHFWVALWETVSIGMRCFQERESNEPIKNTIT